MDQEGAKFRSKSCMHLKYPLTNGDTRMGRNKTINGWIYSIAQWYPRMEVYDDISGWNVIPYTGDAEFYLNMVILTIQLTRLRI